MAVSLNILTTSASELLLGLRRRVEKFLVKPTHTPKKYQKTKNSKKMDWLSDVLADKTTSSDSSSDAINSLDKYETQYKSYRKILIRQRSCGNETCLMWFCSIQKRESKSLNITGRKKDAESYSLVINKLQGTF